MPKADKEQRKHLLARIDQRHGEIEADLQRRDGRKQDRFGWWEWEEPEHIKAARALIEAYEEKREAEWKKKQTALARLRNWFREQALFIPAVDALQLLKAYEALSADQALAAGTTMEDRNDMPLGLPGITPMIEVDA